MSDTYTAVADLLRGVPTRIRQTLYGLFGVVILLDGVWDVLPDDVATPLVTTFGVLGSVLALANTKQTQPPTVPENFPDEFA